MYGNICLHEKHLDTFKIIAKLTLYPRITLWAIVLYIQRGHFNLVETIALLQYYNGSF